MCSHQQLCEVYDPHLPTCFNHRCWGRSTLTPSLPSTAWRCASSSKASTVRRSSCTGRRWQHGRRCARCIRMMPAMTGLIIAAIYQIICRLQGEPGPMLCLEMNCICTISVSGNRQKIVPFGMMVQACCLALHDVFIPRSISHPCMSIASLLVWYRRRQRTCIPSTVPPAHSCGGQTTLIR